MTRTGRLVWLIGPLAVIVVAATAVGVLLLARVGQQRGMPSPVGSVSGSAGPFAVHGAAEPGERDNVRLVSALLSGLPAQLAAGNNADLTAAARQRYQNVKTAVPPGATLAVHSETWRRVGSVASVTVTMIQPGQPGGPRYVVMLIRQDGAWRVADTYPLDAR